MRRIKVLIIALVLAAGCSVVIAGLAHTAKKTYWSADPSPVSLWRRNNTLNEVYPANPAADILVWDNSERIMVGTNTVQYNTGFWVLDASADIMPISITADMYSNRGDFGTLGDVEWELDSNADLQIKEGLF